MKYLSPKIEKSKAPHNMAQMYTDRYGSTCWANTVLEAAQNQFETNQYQRNREEETARLYQQDQQDQQVRDEEEQKEAFRRRREAEYRRRQVEEQRLRQEQEAREAERKSHFCDTHQIPIDHGWCQQCHDEEDQMKRNAERRRREDEESLRRSREWGMKRRRIRKENALREHKTTHSFPIGSCKYCLQDTYQRLLKSDFYCPNHKGTKLDLCDLTTYEKLVHPSGVVFSNIGRWLADATCPECSKFTCDHNLHAWHPDGNTRVYEVCHPIKYALWVRDLETDITNPSE